MPKTDLPFVDVYRTFALRNNLDLMAQAFAPIVGDYIRPLALPLAYSVHVPGADILYAHLILIQRRIRFDQIAAYVHVLGGAGAAGRLGIYNVDWEEPTPTYYPTSLILDAGTIDCTAAVARTIAINQTLDPSWYALAFVLNDATISLRAGLYQVTPLGGVAPDVPSSHGWSIAQAYGVLPDPFPAGAAPISRSYLTLRVAQLL